MAKSSSVCHILDSGCVAMNKVLQLIGSCIFKCLR